MLYMSSAGAVETGAGAGDTAAALVGGELCSVARGGEEVRTRGLTVPSTGPGHAWIKEKVERVEDFYYT